MQPYHGAPGPSPTFQRPPWGIPPIPAQARLCARCTYPLQPTWDKSGIAVDHCFRCGGTFVDFGRATSVVGEKADPRCWPREAFAKPPVLGPLFCPSGHGPMWTTLLGWEGKFVEIDSCGHCHGLWLDAREAEVLGEITTAAYAENARPGSSKGTLAQVAVYLVQLATFIPVEVYHPVKRRPLVVPVLAGALGVIFVIEIALAVTLGDRFVHAVSFYPKSFERGYVWQLVTYAFLHGGIFHLLGNLYFLWVFGDNVEDRLGRSRFVVLYMIAAIVGGLAHWLGNLHGTEPMVGASGAIAGLMGAYMVLFPRVKLWVVFLFVQFKLRAVWYLLIWGAMQFLELLDPKHQVAWLCHLGGFVAGALLARLLDPARRAPAAR